MLENKLWWLWVKAILGFIFGNGCLAVGILIIKLMVMVEEAPWQVVSICVAFFILGILLLIQLVLNAIRIWRYDYEN